VNAGTCAPPEKKDNPAWGNPELVSNPVVGVTHQQAADYCAFVNGRLPTEAEWEKAARGPDGNLFPWGDGLPECSQLNFNYCTGKVENVKSYPDGVSYYGLFDMSGNIREWAADWYSVEYNPDGSITDPLGPELGQKRAVRSSSFSDSTDFAIAAHRFSLKPEERMADLGFRCVVEDPTFYAPYCETLILYGSDPDGNPTDDVIPIPDNCVQPHLQVSNDCTVSTDSKVTVSPWPLPAGATLNEADAAAGCSGGPPVYTCTGSGTMSIDPQTCSLPPAPGGGTCAPGYVKSPDPGDPNKFICTGQGIGQNCLRGFVFDPLLYCCEAEDPGMDQYTICAPGFYKVGDACIPAGNNPPPLVGVSVTFGPVALCPGRQTGTCQPPSGGCGFKETWDYGTCSCVSTYP
jgi:hypothetical protein